ncbi:hypothetical protein ACJX0J_025027, partial [Zea mays]
PIVTLSSFIDILNHMLIYLMDSYCITRLIIKLHILTSKLQVRMKYNEYGDQIIIESIDGNELNHIIKDMLKVLNTRIDRRSEILVGEVFWIFAFVPMPILHILPDLSIKLGVGVID